MKKNRKKVETYRFNGYPHLNPRSILPVKIEELKQGINELEAKLADPSDCDDKKWTAIWLKRYREELEKKQRGRELKQKERQVKTRQSRNSSD